MLGLDSVQAVGQLLEVGTGSGGIAHYFASHAHVSWHVSAVDVVDNRQVIDGYDFQLTSGCKLPFPDASFDVVVSNHVIEHVGDAHSQLSHLEELRRVLKPEGRGYLAEPNRWMVVEPHYRLPFLSWLPRDWRTPYLRISGKGVAYDVSPCSYDNLNACLATRGCSFATLALRPYKPWLAWSGPIRSSGLFFASYHLSCGGYHETSCRP